MKNPSLFIFLLLISSSMLAQKTESERIEVTYKQYPQKPLEASVTRYKIKIYNAIAAPVPPKEVIAQSLGLSGFDISDDHPDVILALSFDYFQPHLQIGPKLISYGSPLVYTARIIVDMKASVHFLTPDTYYEFYNINNFEAPLSYQVESGMYGSEDGAREAMQDDKIIEGASMQCMYKALATIGNTINNQFGYAPKTEAFPIYTIQSKDFDYAEVNQAKDKYIQAMKQFSLFGPTAENKKLLDEATAIWMKNVGEYNPRDKKARISKKNISELYMNLALANIWLGNFTEAKKYFDLATGEGDLNNVKQSVNHLLTSLAEGYQQDIMRKENKLSIARRESELYSAPEFKLENHDFRIKYITFYNSNDAKQIEYREVFEYDGNGLVKKVYKQKFDADRKNYYEAYDVCNITYDHRQKVMSFYKPGLDAPVATQTFGNGHIISRAGKDEKGSFNCTYTYDKTGNCVKTLNTSDNWTEVRRFKYDRRHRVTEKLLTTYYGQETDSIPTSKYVLWWNEESLNKIDIYYNSSHAKELIQKSRTATYKYDAAGYVTEINEGSFSERYTFDASGNFVDLIINTDSNPIHCTYVWEPGAGNAPLYLEIFNDTKLDPNVVLRVF
jgi:hypothetical protein